MYAIVEIGGKQVKVEKNAEILVDLFSAKEGDKLNYDTVTIYRDDNDILIGTPYVKGVSVDAKVVEPLVKGEKLTVFKYKHKVNYRVKTGHRQKYSKIMITNISKGGASTATKTAPKATATKTAPKATATKTAPKTTATKTAPKATDKKTKE